MATTDSRAGHRKRGVLDKIQIQEPHSRRRTDDYEAGVQFPIDTGLVVYDDYDDKILAWLQSDQSGGFPLQLRDEESLAALALPTRVARVVDPDDVIVIEYGETSNAKFRDRVGRVSSKATLTLVLGERSYKLVVSRTEYDHLYFDLGVVGFNTVIECDMTNTGIFKIADFYYSIIITKQDREAMKDETNWGGYGARGMFFIRWIATSLGATTIVLNDSWTGHGVTVVDPVQLGRILACIDDFRKGKPFDPDLLPVYLANQIFYNETYARKAANGDDKLPDVLPFTYNSKDLSAIMKAIRDKSPTPPGIYFLAPVKFEADYARFTKNGSRDKVIQCGFYGQYGFVATIDEKTGIPYNRNRTTTKIVNAKSRF